MVQRAMKYKKSEYNYIQKNGDYYLVYNTLYNSLVRLNEQEYCAYDQIRTADPEMEKEFVENCLWVDSEIDEKAKYLACAEAYTLYVLRPLSVTVTTTMKCNARCPYCYEKGVKQTDIVDGAEDKIVNFIKSHNHMNEVHLIWFGGEPLMNTTFMDSLCNQLKAENMLYSSYIITNGSLLNQDIIVRKFTDWNIKDMQVTLDGTSEVYESTKKYIHPEAGKFYSILNNIRSAAQAGVFINIRLNIGKTNQNSILALLKELDKIYARYENVVFYPAFLTGEADPMTEEERVGFVKKMLLSLKNIKKLTASTKFYSLPRMHACMNGDPQSFSIDVNGNVYSCEHCVGHEEERIGTIEDMFRENDSRGKDVSFRKECQDCVFLPKCFGGCEANWIEGENPCMIEKYLIKSYLQIL